MIRYYMKKEKRTNMGRKDIPIKGGREIYKIRRVYGMEII